MPFVHWENKFSISNDWIDAEHRMLFLLCRKLDYALKNDLSEILLRSILLEIKTFTEFHFLSEENLMQEIGYPGIGEHSSLHRRLLFGLEEMTGDIVRHKTSEFSMLEFLHSWLLNHIEHVDMKLGAYARSAPARPVGEKFYGHFLKPRG